MTCVFYQNSRCKTARALHRSVGPEVTLAILDSLIPSPAMVEIDTAELAVDADRAWKAVRALDLAQSTLVRTLFALRTIPDRLKGRQAQLRLRVDDLVSTPDEPGFQVLAEDCPHEIAVGAIGKVWRPVIPFVHVPDAAAFAAFSQAGYIKVAWALRVVAEGERTSRVEFELRVAATDDDAMKKFSRYFRLIGPGSHFIRRVLLAQLERDLGTPEALQNERALPGDELMARDVLEGVSGAAIAGLAFLTPFLRHQRNRWGLDAKAAAREYPGDTLIPDPRWSWTHGIEIEAAAGAVWPWVAQLGADRGGFYSYQWLENVAGCDLRNAESIHPEWALHPGDALVLHPDVPALRVVEVEPPRYLLAEAAADPAARTGGKSWIAVSWLFFVESLGERRCRLISRYRCACSDDVPTRLSFGPMLVEPDGFAMDRRMLLGIKERADRVVPERLRAACTARQSPATGNIQSARTPNSHAPDPPTIDQPTGMAASDHGTVR